jgi:Bacterial extracellular solute-binding proteins, family 3
MSRWRRAVLVPLALLCIWATSVLSGEADLPEIKQRNSLRVLVNPDEKRPEFFSINAAGIPAANRDDTIPTGGYAEALRSGKISAAVWGVESAIASQREDPAIELGMFLGPPGRLAYGVRKEDTELRQALDDYLDNVRKTPTWSRLVVKYFGEAAPDILKKARSSE